MAKQPNKRKSKNDGIKKLAYQMGLIERGRKNPESQVFESFQNGLKGAQKKKQKPLF